MPHAKGIKLKPSGTTCGWMGTEYRLYVHQRKMDLMKLDSRVSTDPREKDMRKRKPWGTFFLRKHFLHLTSIVLLGVNYEFKGSSQSLCACLQNYVTFLVNIKCL